MKATKPLVLNNYKTAAGAAKALYKYLYKVCESWGYNPEIELNLLTPKESAALGLGKCWRVMWESGPYEWGVYLSLGGNLMEGTYKDKGPVHWNDGFTDWYLEPHYSFDVGFPSWK